MPGRNQQLVLDALTRSERPMGAYGLLGLLRQEGLRSPLQIYRALDPLVEQGLVHRIESLSAFALCVHSECGTHGRAAFAICANCGRASEVHDPALERVLRRLPDGSASKPTRPRWSFRVYARLARIEQAVAFRLRAIQSARA
ncbi:transcriptional repressor [Mesorhizobium sp.]|uniref:Fur family transcriptional regulator n=1 Tax=Mesorhizobium sp. TaxID=1871066 RepID=UPI00257EA7EA|nr:transcriptional repressor [Mesorhizobium sp.]